jgi:hypothetical protein
VVLLQIARPIEMKSINGKILGNTFRNTAEFQKAVNLMCDNAMLYNIDESQEYQAAVNLKALCADELKKADVLGIPLTEAQRAKLGTSEPLFRPRAEISVSAIRWRSFKLWWLTRPFPPNCCA